MTGTSDDLGDFVRLLRSERRRILIDLLHDYQLECCDDVVTTQLRDLGRQVAAIEDDVGSVDVDQASRRSTKNSLHQTHIPLLEEYGIVEYDGRSKEVTTTERTWAFAELIQTFEVGIETSNLDEIRPGGTDD
ncbi:hypothetical protein [Natrinema hispanicum]|uniref:DUF7344 domain-containing protein n=1 Tax=Natrinema hispanicum TaxID=392421 RepID=A0A1I0IVH3_9EURY|nr:hypothetical protein [Natrinema hispanicum]SEU01054.1 hypothetical protein SAMN04488694_12629 [Natrinema hispanicum]